MSRKFKTMDGNQAAAHVSYGFTEVAAIYPITPSSPMPEHVDEWSASGRKNIFGNTVQVVEMQSEAAAAAAVHGSLQAGALTTTFTSSQGLLLMLPNLYKVAGELLPGVFQVAARALAAHALAIFGDHQDVMAARATGCAMLAESSVQEVMDLSAVAHLTAIKTRVPFINFFDGFRTSHEIQKIQIWDYEDLKPLVDMEAVQAFRERALNPDAPVTRGTAENPDVYFQHREASNKFYLALPDVVEHYMGEVNKLAGTNYQLFNYIGAPDATDVIVTMGSSAQVVESTVDYLNKLGRKVGFINVHLFRPFATDRLLKALPKTVERIAVLDRTKEPGALAEPLFLDVQAAVVDGGLNVKVIAGRYGLSSKDIIPADVVAVFDNLASESGKKFFTLGINDDVTFLSLERAQGVDVHTEGLSECKFWGFGSDGTVGANKSAIKIIGDHTDLYAQAYFDYDSKKSGGVTMSHLRFGKHPINLPYLITEPQFVACHRQSYVHDYDLIRGIRKGGTFLLNCTWTPEELTEHLPAKLRREIAEKELNFYIINAAKIASEIGLGGRINMVTQAAFFKLTEIIPVDEAIKYLKDSVVTSYGKKGQNIVDMNNAAIDAGVDALVKVDVPADWKNAVEEGTKATKPGCETCPSFVQNIAQPINAQAGYDLPVSTFEGYEDGTLPAGTAAYEKRGAALFVPKWLPENCIQCNQCSIVCPHATIRPILATEEEVAAAPAHFDTIDALGAKDLKFRIAVSPLDCLGCGNCVDICPSPKGKAIVMTSIDSEIEQAEAWAYGVALPTKANPMKKDTVKGSQFEKPLFEFSGACAGCGETPYAKLITQLFGDRMMIANATGCSSIWGASMPASPYTTNQQGQGPSWANSLFEDNAEYGYGMYIGTKKVREQLVATAVAAAATATGELKAALEDWAEKAQQGAGSRDRVNRLLAAIEAEGATTPELQEIVAKKQYLVKRSHWIFGGDGWAYDIGFGGVDHVLASGEDVNIFVFDTEVYSNTGGQASKSTNVAAVAQFAASGKRTKKKDLGMMAMSYGYVYVAQIAMGADKNQMMKAITEAEAYPGPSLIIAYSPCINHGIKAGMGKAQEEQRKAVAAGYWDLYRFNPTLKEAGKNPFTLDSKEPTESFQDFLKGEVRYASLAKAAPDVAEELFAKTEQDAKDRRLSYVRLQHGFEEVK